MMKATPGNKRWILSGLALCLLMGGVLFAGFHGREKKDRLGNKEKGGSTEAKATAGGTAPAEKGIDVPRLPAPSDEEWDSWIYAIQEAAQKNGVSETQVEEILERYPKALDVETRRLLIWALGRTRSERAIQELLQKLLHDPDETIRHAASLALQFHLEEGVTEALLTALQKDVSSAVKATAAYALKGRRDDRRILSGVLMERARLEVDPNVRKAVVWSLGGYLNEESQAALIGMATQDYDRDIRIAALSALQSAQGDSLIAILEPLAFQEQDAEVRHAAEETILAIKKALNPALMGEHTLSAPD